MGDEPMRFWSLIALALGVLSGCSASDTNPAAFDLEGAWLYLGPSDVPHTLTVDHSSMIYADVEGQWSSTWAITAYDNGARHFQIAFGSGSGAYLPVGANMSGAYEVSGALLTVQLASSITSYPALQSPGTCTGTADGAPLPECRLYIKK